MIRLIPRNPKDKVAHYLGVLESDVKAHEALGWTAGAVERRPSVGEPIVLMCWVGDGKPPRP